MSGDTRVMTLDAARTEGQRSGRPSAGAWRDGVVVALVLLVPLAGAQLGGGAGFFYYLGSQLAVWATFAMAYDLLIGFAGITSFGHAMFFGLGDIRGAVLGATISGVLISFLSAAQSNTVATLTVFVLMAVTVVLRPQGLLGLPDVRR